jgi:hypothetical protein
VKIRRRVPVRREADPTLRGGLADPPKYERSGSIIPET